MKAIVIYALSALMVAGTLINLYLTCTRNTEPVKQVGIFSYFRDRDAAIRDAAGD